jgi:tRNA-dihydrouridine synthase A
MNQEFTAKPKAIPARLSVAPMMDWTDRHCRYFHRLLSPHALLYTEMVTTGALIHGDAPRHLRFHAAERPVALQLGGSDPDDLAACAEMAAEYGYDEINLNCGCPSDRVQKGRFGACLMAEPDLVAASVAAMQRAAPHIPVTVKTRIGIDHQDSYEFLKTFVDTIADKGCTTFIIHARKAWLSGLSPKENREKPPLHYDRVDQLKKDFPELRFVLNGGITSLDQAAELLGRFDGIMIGREAYQNPWILAAIESEIFHTPPAPARDDIARAMIPYIERENAQYGTEVKSVTRHMTGLFQGLPGARAWRQSLSTLPHEPGATAKHVIETALAGLRDRQKRAA